MYDFSNNFREIISKLAKLFKVSELVVARRASDLGYITKTEYKEFYDEYIAKDKTKKQPTGGDFYQIQQMLLGRIFSEAVIRAVKEANCFTEKLIN